MADFDIAGATVLITGGNTGIGKETAIDLARRGARVVFTSRDAARGDEALAEIREASGRDDVRCLPLDLADLESVRRCAARFLEDEPRLDVLVANAGINLVRGARQLSKQGHELHFAVNHLGHMLLTELLLERMKACAPARVVSLSSHAYMMCPDGLRFDDLQMESDYRAFQCYGHSKLANILWTVELAERLAGTGVTVNAVHPGYVKTELGRWRPEDKETFVAEVSPPASATKKKREGPDLSNLPPPVSAAEGASTSLYVATSRELDGVSGRYFADSAACDLQPHASDAAAAKRLWEVSTALIEASE
jgi:NAD(P)-dependent dehydrogenase (short-subunit alcohol dehydrogenase family)